MERYQVGLGSGDQYSTVHEWSARTVKIINDNDLCVDTERVREVTIIAQTLHELSAATRRRA